MTYLFECFSCGKSVEIEMTEKEYNAYCAKIDTVQRIFPKKDLFYREALISHMCYDCISNVFNRPKPGEDWGEVVAECECCGSALYAKDAAVCPKCGWTLGAPEEYDDDEV